MNTDQILDAETLWAPFFEGGETGVNLRDVSVASNRALFDGIRGSRQSARKKEMVNSDPAALLDADAWQPVFKQCVEALATRSKDLEVATYLIESAVRVHGFVGLRDGLIVYRGLVERYWDSLFPQMSDGSPSPRVAPLGSLNGDADKEGSLRYAIARVRLTSGNGNAFGLFHHECGVNLETMSPEQRQSRLDSGWTSLSVFEESARKTNIIFLQKTLETLNVCGAELEQLRSALSEKCGSEAPPLSKIAAAIDSCREIVEKFAGVKTEAEAGPGQVENGAAAPSGNGGFIVPKDFRDREEAFAVVAKVAEFFKKTEPQSPVIFALEQAVRWGKMPLPDLLTELISDEMARRQLFQLIGIRSNDGTG